MANCLVTKMKGVVNNNELPYMGYTKLKVLSTPSANPYLSVDYNQVINDVIKKNGVDVYSIQDREIRQYLPCVQNDVFAIPQKYNMTVFSLVLGEGNGFFDAVADLSGCSVLNTISTRNNQSFKDWIIPNDIKINLTSVSCYFDTNNTKSFPLSIFADFTSLQTLYLYRAYATGDIMDIVGCCKDMTNLNLMSNPSLKGNLSDFAQSLYDAHKTSTLQMNITNDTEIILPSGITRGTVYISFDNEGYHISNTNPDA